MREAGDIKAGRRATDNGGRRLYKLGAVSEDMHEASDTPHHQTQRVIGHTLFVDRVGVGQSKEARTAITIEGVTSRSVWIP